MDLDFYLHKTTPHTEKHGSTHWRKASSFGSLQEQVDHTTARYVQSTMQLLQREQPELMARLHPLQQESLKQTLQHALARTLPLPEFNRIPQPKREQALTRLASQLLHATITVQTFQSAMANPSTMSQQLLMNATAPEQKSVFQHILHTHLPGNAIHTQSISDHDTLGSITQCEHNAGDIT